MKIKPSLCFLGLVCAAQLGFALPAVTDAEPSSVQQTESDSGYLSSAPVAAPELTQNTTQNNTSINDDLLAKINAMEQQVQSLQGRVDELQHELKRSQEDQALVIAQLNKKMAEIPVQAPAAPAAKVVTTNASVAKVASVPVVAVTTKTASPVTPEAQEKSTYDAAYSLVSAKAYVDAMEAFTEYLTIYPDGKYAAQANYWLGELNASQQQYPAAIKYLETVVNKYPQSNKVPDAMLKLGIINKRLGNDAKAQSWFGRVTKEYPQSSSAQSAKEYISNTPSI